jgi:tRNA(fMet)-specific endonuclease VapC
MRYLLDTNTCIRYINGRAPRIFEHMQDIPDADIAISSVTKGEMFAGSARSQSPQHSRAKQDAFFVRFAGLDYDEAAANEFGRVRAYLENAGTPIGPYDMQIAAIAILHDLILVTHNVKEFDRITWLKINDWEV